MVEQKRVAKSRFSKEAFITADGNPLAKTTSGVYAVGVTTMQSLVNVHYSIIPETQPILDDVDSTYPLVRMR